MSSCAIHLCIRQYLKENGREIGSTTRGQQIKLHVVLEVVNKTRSIVLSGHVDCWLFVLFCFLFYFKAEFDRFLYRG